VPDPALSFVIPVRNDAERLRRCLQSIAAATPDGVPVEIVVADNGSTDASAQVARAAGATVLELPGVGLGELRNRAARAARGELLAFVDADHEIGTGWVEAARTDLALPGVAGAGAPCHAPKPGTWVQQIYDRLRRRPAGQEETDWLGSGNLIVRREQFHAIGGFDTTLETCEDVDLCRKLRATGGRLLSDERLYNIHYGDPRTLRHVFFGELWRGRDNIRVSLRAPRSGRSLISAAIPLFILVALATAVVGVLTLAPIGLALAAAAIGAVILLIALRAGRLTHGTTDWPKAFAVASAYELGRSFAVASRVGYERRRRGAAA
jgi:glycosyltransferase involved in cell wall biosynthesis